MRKILFFLCIAGTLNSFGQTKSLITVGTATPKTGQKAAFEAGWIAHLKKFHQKDTTNRRSVFEILTGTRTGSYYLVTPGMAWADLDIERPTKKEHDADLASTVSSSLASLGAQSIFRWADTLSYRPEVKASKFQVTTYHIKSGKQSEITDEIKRSIAVNKKINSTGSTDGYIQQLSGSTPTVVIVRHYKDGFKEIDPDYMKTPTDQFKNAYIELFGAATWEKRMNILTLTCDLVEVELMKFRADLSSAQ